MDKAPVAHNLPRVKEYQSQLVKVDGGGHVYITNTGRVLSCEARQFYMQALASLVRRRRRQIDTDRYQHALDARVVHDGIERASADLKHLSLREIRRRLSRDAAVALHSPQAVLIGNADERASIMFTLVSKHSDGLFGHETVVAASGARYHGVHGLAYSHAICLMLGRLVSDVYVVKDAKSGDRKFTQLSSEARRRLLARDLSELNERGELARPTDTSCQCRGAWSV